MSRDAILGRIVTGPEQPLPPMPTPAPAGADPVADFIERLESIGGRGRRVRHWQEVLFHLQTTLREGQSVLNGIERLAPYNVHRYLGAEAAGLESVHTVYLRGSIGVAENGAVWLPETQLQHRLLPFVCRELVLVLEAGEIVSDLHAAYSRIDVRAGGYGVFIAGPSKTADIEQALVIGAHGPLALQVLIVN